MLVRIAIAALVSAGLVAAPARRPGRSRPNRRAPPRNRSGNCHGRSGSHDSQRRRQAGGRRRRHRHARPDRAYKSAKTDAAGHYTIDWPDGTGDYLVHVAAVGYETFRKRVTRAGADTVFVVDASLRSTAVQELGPVVTTARKPKPDRNPRVRRRRRRVRATLRRTDRQASARCRGRSRRDRRRRCPA